jgi:hypothetical protein
MQTDLPIMGTSMMIPVIAVFNTNISAMVVLCLLPYTCAVQNDHVQKEQAKPYEIFRAGQRVSAERR